MSPRNPRNNPYESAGEVLAGHRARALVLLWRWRTEIALLFLAMTVMTATVNAAASGNWLPSLLLTSAVSAPAATRLGRGWVTAHAWCVISRHRIQRVCLETPMHTRAGRIPLVLWISPIPEGERALILTRAGICAEDFEAFAGEIEAACAARRVRVLRHRRYATLVTVEIVRREAAPGVAAPGLARCYGGPGWTPIPSTRDLEEPHDTRHHLVLPQVG
ncbi:hypothetical protein HNP84_007435 [Thermocatellispora tengchongensis]|uniref:Uncharacterized protein n=2 Tax=Thermocatellispora tengchongensis TaxID=1073253 RepID=A0A840PIF0_9ACTN|nr:hypothetical protein [Thermocatellispora tengchongensis]MBB5137683.1 hypothetical protein [Thermocatellispora tengchongensis]